MPDPSTCVFCEIVARRAPAQIVDETTNSLLIIPLGPVVAGHVLVIPKTHAADAAEWPALTGVVMTDAALWAARWGVPFNLITSAGREATQSVFHLHIHYVPRAADDGLMLPWGTAWGENPQDPHRCRRVRELERQLEDRALEVDALAAVNGRG